MKKKLLPLLTALLFFSSAMWAQIVYSPVSFPASSFNKRITNLTDGTNTLTKASDAVATCVGAAYYWENPVQGKDGEPDKLQLIFWYDQLEKEYYTINSTTTEFPPCGDYEVHGLGISNLQPYCKQGCVAGKNSTTKDNALYIKSWSLNGETWKFLNINCKDQTGTYIIQVRKGVGGPYIHATNLPNAADIISEITVGAPTSDANDAATLTISMDDASKGSIAVSKPTTGVSTQGNNTTVTTTKYFWVTVEAKPNQGETFYGWSDGVKDNPRHIQVDDVNKTVTACFTQTLVLNDNENNASKLSANLNKEQDIQLMRTFQAGMWNTVCLPFALNASQIAAAFGEGTQVGTMTRGETVEDELFLDFSTNVTVMEAGQPYIIFPGANANVVNPTFEGVAITTTTAGSYQSPTSDITFVGVFSPVANLEVWDYYLGVNNTIHPTELGTLKGFRAYFHWDESSATEGGEGGDGPAPEAPKRVRMVINSTETVTADEQLQMNEATSTKMMLNGQLIIVRDGIRYNAQGQVIE